MAAATSPSTEQARFDGVARAVHWANAGLFLFLLLTGLVLSFGPLSAAVGRRTLVRDLHVWSGLTLPLPVVAGALARSFRAEAGWLNRWTAEDRRWLRRLGRRSARRYEFGKYHPGQKLNAAFVAGSIPVMLLTGAVMKWYEPFPLSWRTGATFVHDWLATALLLVIAGHIVKALSTPGALGPMLIGTARRRTAGGPGPIPDGPPPG
jgi:formate dehydrogenase subunit gamma